jgi:hypothetical protein
MRQKKMIETTLGDLIVAVTDEVRRFVRNPSDLYMVTACVLNDRLIRRELRIGELPRRRNRSGPRF